MEKQIKKKQEIRLMSQSKAQSCIHYRVRDQRRERDSTWRNRWATYSDNNVKCFFFFFFFTFGTSSWLLVLVWLANPDMDLCSGSKTRREKV
jgi:hypothetical protein